MNISTPLRVDGHRCSDWKTLTKIFGAGFCKDALDAADEYDDAPFRRFLDWVSLNADAKATIVRFYGSAPSSTSKSQRATSDVAKIITEYLDAREAQYAENWRRRTLWQLCDVFTALGQREDRSYPPFHRKVLPTPKAPSQGKTISLANVLIEALQGVLPRLRDETAIDLVRDEAIRAFDKWEAIFDFGQTVLFGERPEAADEDAWSRIRIFLQSVREAVLTGDPQRMTHPHDGLNSPAIWEAAGLSALDGNDFRTNLSGEQYMMSRTVYGIAFGCIGSSATATAAVKILFCLSTGWNKEQIDLLPENPYAFRTEDLAAVADEAFLAAYKARAGHYVGAYLERGFRNFVPDEEQLLKLWEEEIGEKGEDGRSLLNDTSVLAVLDRYARMVSAIREYSPDDFKDRFFLGLTCSGVTAVVYSIPSYRIGPLTSLRGVGYNAIRQSFINVNRRRVGSLAVTKYQSNNTNEATILAHYDDTAIQLELNEAHAFWQNCLQAELLSRNPDLRPRFNIPEDDFEWFSHLAIISGISASLDIVPKRLSVTDTDYFEFEPSVETYIEIYLNRRSVACSRRELGNRRWQVQAIPVLGMLRAIRRHAFDSGFGDMYSEAVRQAFRKLKSGEIALPRTLDLFR